MPDEILTQAEVAQMLKVADKTLYTTAQRGEVPACGQPRNPFLALLPNLLRARSIIAANRCCEDHALSFLTRDRSAQEHPRGICSR